MCKIKAELKTQETATKNSVIGYLLNEVKGKSLTLPKRYTTICFPRFFATTFRSLDWFILTLEITYLEIMKIIRYKMCRGSFGIDFC